MALCLAVFDGQTHASSQQEELLHQRVNDQICFFGANLALSSGTSTVLFANNG